MSFPSHFSNFSFNGLGNRRAMAGTYRGRVDFFSRVFFVRMLEQTGSSFTNAIFEKALEASITCNLLGICIVRMIPKPSKNGSAFRQITIQIQAWRHQNRGPEDSGADLEAFWAIFGYPGRFWKRLGPSWKRLGASWRPPGPFWNEKGGQHDFKLAPKTEPKSIKNRFKDRSLVWCHLESSFFMFSLIFGIKNRAMLVRKCIQKSILC